MHQSVADVMTLNPIVVQPTTSIQDVIKLLADKRISGLPVVDVQGFLVGVVSATDLMWQETGVTPPAYVMILDSVIYLQNPASYDRDLHKALGQTVADLMTAHPISITADEPVSQAARLMHEHHVQRLPVIDETRHVVGILTRGDIIHAMAAERLAVA